MYLGSLRVDSSFKGEIWLNLVDENESQLVGKTARYSLRWFLNSLIGFKFVDFLKVNKEFFSLFSIIYKGTHNLNGNNNKYGNFLLVNFCPCKIRYHVKILWDKRKFTKEGLATLRFFKLNINKIFSKYIVL